MFDWIEPERGQPWLAGAGVAAPIVLTVFIIVAGLAVSDSNHVSKAISELGEIGGEDAWIMRTGFIVFGVLTLPFALALHRGVADEGRMSRVGPSLVVWFAVGAGILNGIFSLDRGNPSPPESFSGWTHVVAGATGFLAVGMAALFMAARLARDERWRRFRFYSIASGVATIALFVLFGPIDAFPDQSGLVQRLMAATMLSWIEVMALRLLWLSARPAAAATAPAGISGPG